MMFTDLLWIMLYIVIEFAVGLFFFWGWTWLFDIRLKRSKMIIGAVLWALVGIVSAIVFKA